MDGWILREQTTHYTYMPPIMKALGCDLIRSMTGDSDMSNAWERITIVFCLMTTR
jgi:hypothetical protein